MLDSVLKSWSYPAFCDAMKKISEEQLNRIIGQSLHCRITLDYSLPPPTTFIRIQSDASRIAVERWVLKTLKATQHQVSFFTTLQFSLRSATTTAAVCKRWCNLRLGYAQAEPIFGLPPLVPWQGFKHIDYEVTLTQNSILFPHSD